MLNNSLKRPLALLTCLLFLVPAFSLAAEPTIEERLTSLEDREAIRTLLLNYGRHLDNRDWDDFADLFAPNDGKWNGGMGIATGQEEVKAMMISTIGTENTGTNGTGLSNLHLLSNEFIDVDGNTATALSKWVFVMTASEGGPEDVFVGHYVDQLIKINKQWKFKERVVHGDIMSATTVDELNSNNQ